MNSLISIIITTKNEESVLEHLLQSIKEQTYKNFEIIIVDNKSTDNTKNIALKYTKKFYEFGPERSAQRNFGLKKSLGDIVIFLDADMQLSIKVLETCREQFKNPKVAALVIPERSIGKGYWSNCKIYERECYLGVDWIESARCFRKSVIKQLGGYDESMSGPEDFDLPQRVEVSFGKTAISRIEAYIIHNEGRISLASQLKKKYYYGLSLNKYVAKNQNRHKALKQGNILLRFQLFISNPKKVLKHSMIIPGVFIMKTGELLFLFIGMMQSKAKGGI